MSRVLILALILTASTFGASPGPLVAVVRVREIYAALPATEDLQKQVKQERDAILSDPRAAELRRIIAELQTIQARLSDSRSPVDRIVPLTRRTSPTRTQTCLRSSHSPLFAS